MKGLSQLALLFIFIVFALPATAHDNDRQDVDLLRPVEVHHSFRHGYAETRACRDGHSSRASTGTRRHGRSRAKRGADRFTPAEQGLLSGGFWY